MILFHFPIDIFYGYHNQIKCLFPLKLPSIGNKIFLKTFGKRSTYPLAKIKIGSNKFHQLTVNQIEICRRKGSSPSEITVLLLTRWAA